MEMAVPKLHDINWAIILQFYGEISWRIYNRNFSQSSAQCKQLILNIVIAIHPIMLLNISAKETITIDFVMSTWKTECDWCQFWKIEIYWYVVSEMLDMVHLSSFGAASLIFRGRFQQKKKQNECKPKPNQYNNELRCIWKQMNLNSQFYALFSILLCNFNLNLSFGTPRVLSCQFLFLLP